MALILDGTNGLSDVDGTAGTPAIRGSDANTGIFFPAADTIAFSEGGVESMRLDSAGNVGIGTSSPVGTLDVVSPSSSLGINLRGRSADDIGTLSFYTNNGATNLAQIQMRPSDNEFRFLVGGARSLTYYTNGSERMRIDSSGNLLVGTTNSSPTAGTGLKITAGSSQADSLSIVTGATTNAGLTTYQLYSTGAAAYRFYVGAGGTIFATSTSISAISDVTLKENVRDLETGLTEVMALKPRRFDWKNGDGQNVAGFIAQEVEQVLPDLVYDYQYTAEETKKSIKMGDILPTLVKAIQEQQAIIQSLTARIEALENQT